MAIINTGKQRATELTIEKRIGNVSASGYPHVYDLRNEFNDYSGVTTEHLATMPIAEYLDRLSAFVLYVKGIEIGIVVDMEEAYRDNFDSCPIG